MEENICKIRLNYLKNIWKQLKSYFVDFQWSLLKICGFVDFIWSQLALAYKQTSLEVYSIIFRSVKMYTFWNVNLVLNLKILKK